mgnify:FL=1
MHKLLEKLTFESNITYSFYNDEGVTAGVWIGNGINDVIEVRGSTKREATDKLFVNFKNGGYKLH